MNKVKKDNTQYVSNEEEMKQRVEDKTLYISKMQAKQLLEHKIRYVERTVNIHGHIIKIKVELSD